MCCVSHLPIDRVKPTSGQCLYKCTVGLSASDGCVLDAEVLGTCCRLWRCRRLYRDGGGGGDDDDDDDGDDD